MLGHERYFTELSYKHIEIAGSWFRFTQLGVTEMTKPFFMNGTSFFLFGCDLSGNGSGCGVKAKSFSCGIH